MALLVDLETICLPAATVVTPSSTDVLHGAESPAPAGIPIPRPPLGSH